MRQPLARESDLIPPRPDPETRDEAKMPRKVILYSANGDPQKIREMLEEQGIDYEYVDVSG